MFVFVVQRFISTLFVLLMIFAGCHLLVRALPGDPLETLIAETGTSIPIEALKNQLDLDKPFYQAIANDLSRMAHGDFGKSLLTRRSIGKQLKKSFLVTLKLTFLSLLLGLIASLWLGLSAAAKPYGIMDRFCTALGALSAALPTPWIGAFFMILFAIWIPIFHISENLFLPALVLAFNFSGLWSRLIRERVRERLLNGSANGARARGIPEWKVIVKYGLVPASGSLLAYLGTHLGSLLMGAFITEVIFDCHGLGSLLVEAVLRRDYPLIQSATFLSASLAMVGNNLGDAAQSLLERRAA